MEIGTLEGSCNIARAFASDVFAAGVRADRTMASNFQCSELTFHHFFTCFCCVLFQHDCILLSEEEEGASLSREYLDSDVKYSPEK